MKTPTVTDVAKRIESARDFDPDSPTRRSREDFADKLKRAVEERGILLGARTQKQHRENVDRARARYRPRKARRHTASD